MFAPIPTYWQRTLKGLVVWAAAVITVGLGVRWYDKLSNPKIVPETVYEEKVIEKSVGVVKGLDELTNGDVVDWHGNEMCVSSIFASNYKARNNYEDAPIEINLRFKGECE